MSASEEIEPIALRLRAQSLAAELSATTFTQCFTKLGKKLPKSSRCRKLLLCNYRKEKFTAIIFSSQSLLLLVIVTDSNLTAV